MEREEVQKNKRQLSERQHLVWRWEVEFWRMESESFLSYRKVNIHILCVRWQLLKLKEFLLKGRPSSYMQKISSSVWLSSDWSSIKKTCNKTKENMFYNRIMWDYILKRFWWRNVVVEYCLRTQAARKVKFVRGRERLIKSLKEKMFEKLNAKFNRMLLIIVYLIKKRDHRNSFDQTINILLKT